MPPELPAHPSFDVWSLGVILFELCSGRTLFSQDTNNDAMVETADQCRLCVWHTITDAELEPVLAQALTATAEDVAVATNLIRWCLKGDPAKRPTIEEVLAHPFVSPRCRARRHAGPMPMQYHSFQSHAQADASGSNATLFWLYEQLGVHNWVDMRQETLTLEAMQQGVRDSSVFILFLTEHVLSSWFCQQEMLCAIEEGKPIQLVLEVEPRVPPF